MKDHQEDIESFDRLERRSDALDRSLAEIARTDDFMRGQSFDPGPDFAAKVVSAAVLVRRRQSSKLFFITAVLILLLPITTLTILVLWTGSTVEIPSGPLVGQWLDIIGAWISDEKLIQILAAMEAILCLIIIDKLLSRTKMIRSSAH